ncbi:hypothetical protein IDH44_23740 [Paenibacillus sp. IB182496]|uniref:Uncharacterized protein n=1 Tax=Paenibacillus sabuli TaxID=2772509 RepID=A0A927BWL9_9BACL|nr:hypothetical protein [Paenibacillus sabuli]MBD2848218.1 hypothetical protein [Paenibacillus sabuli]
MSKRTERGSVLLPVLGCILILGLLAAPLLMQVNVGLLQAKTSGEAERAYTYAESASAVYVRLIEAAAAEGVTGEELRQLAAALQTQLQAELTAKGMEGGIVIAVRPASGDPTGVDFAVTSGSGARARERVVHLALYPPAPGGGSGGGGPGAGSDGTEFYYRYAVVMPDSARNPVFNACGSGNKLADDAYSNTYITAQYEQEFESYFAYYRERHLALAPVPPDLAGAAGDKTESAALTVSGTRPGVSYAGDIELDSGAAIAVSALPDGAAIRAAGNLKSTTDAHSGIVLEGDVYVGGDFTFQGGKLRIAGDLVVRGDLRIASATDELIVEGDLLVGGSVLTYNSVRQLTVYGDIAVGQNVHFGNTAVIAAQGDVRIGGSLIFENTIDQSSIGGNLLVGGAVQFNNTLERLEIGGSFRIGQSLATKTVNRLVVGSDILIGGASNWGNTVQLLEVGGALVGGGDMRFRVSVNALRIGADFWTMGSLTFDNSVSGLETGGYLAAYRDIRFANNVYSTANGLSGFYAGGTVTFPSWYEWASGTICIDHGPPPSGGDGGGGGYTIGDRTSN